MRRNIRYFSKIFFWLPGLALIAHLIVPHDHHIADSFPLQNKNCPVENNHGDNHKGLPIHCYAFNDLTAEKAGNNILVKKLKNPNTGYSSTSGTLLVQFGNGINIIRNYNNPVFNHPFTDFPQLRAPPVLA